MTIATKTATVAGVGVCSATGTYPLAKIQTGGNSGAYSLKDANGIIVDLHINGDAAQSVFAGHNAAQTDLTAIVTALNAA